MVLTCCDSPYFITLASDEKKALAGKVEGLEDTTTIQDNRLTCAMLVSYQPPTPSSGSLYMYSDSVQGLRQKYELLWFLSFNPAETVHPFLPYKWWNCSVVQSDPTRHPNYTSHLPREKDPSCVLRNEQSLWDLTWLWSDMAGICLVSNSSSVFSPHTPACFKTKAVAKTCQLFCLSLHETNH